MCLDNDLWRKRLKEKKKKQGDREVWCGLAPIDL